MSSQENLDALLVEELRKIHESINDPKLIEDRKNTFDELLASMINVGVIEPTTKALTASFKNIWEELMVLKDLENSKELLGMISEFHDDAKGMDEELNKWISSGPGTNEDNIMDTIEKMYSKCVDISKSALLGWKSEECIKENPIKYFDIEKIGKISESLEKMLDNFVGSLINNAKWPLEIEPDSKSQDQLKRILGIVSTITLQHLSPVSAVSSFVSVVDKLPALIVKHYINRLKTRMEYHFAAEQELGKANRPELLLKYSFDQVRVFKQHLDELGRSTSFAAIRDLLINEVMSILIENYKKTCD